MRGEDGEAKGRGSRRERRRKKEDVEGGRGVCGSVWFDFETKKHPI